MCCLWKHIHLIQITRLARNSDCLSCQIPIGNTPSRSPLFPLKERIALGTHPIYVYAPEHLAPIDRTLAFLILIRRIFQLTSLLQS